MPIVDASSLNFSYNAFDTSAIALSVFTLSDPDVYQWTTSAMVPFYRISLYSFSYDITPIGDGTIGSAYITNQIDTSGISINGLPDISLPDMVDFGAASTHWARFWDNVLAGETTILLSNNGETLNMMGDFTFVGQMQTRIGANDLFRSEGVQTNSFLIGDAVQVSIGGTLNGGDDRFEDTWAAALIGDAGFDGMAQANNGTVNGGNDVFELTDTNYLPTLTVGAILGDVNLSASGSFTNGGNDTITVRNALSVTSAVIGDANIIQSSNMVGGDDTILLETTIQGRAFMNAPLVVGDANSASTTGMQTVQGGADTITLRNVNATDVAGDIQSGSGRLTGGNDTIDIRSTFQQETPVLPYNITATVSDIAGDNSAVSSVAGSEIRGGNDTITVVDTQTARISGDDLTMSSDLFVGGHDTIVYLFRSGTIAPAIEIFGDTDTAYANSYTGGDDVIAVNTIDAVPGAGSIALYGDGDFILDNTSYSISILAGDDEVRLTSRVGQNATLYGDFNGPGSLGDLTLQDGNDTLIAGSGNDVLNGDSGGISAMGATTYSGGNDVLDGRGGDDTLNGGQGVDTAVFSLNQSVHVNLNGITGTDPGNPFEAIGQGNDQLISIENIIGSAQNDILIGNDAFNIIEGGGGADRINGRGGQDTASYAGSSAGVVVNLDTGVTAGGDAAGDRFVSIERLLGSDHNDVFVGTSAANYIDGGLGADYMRGLGGSDTYVVDNTGDRVDESFTGSGGVDTVRSSVSLNLTNVANFTGNIENIVLTGSSGTGAVGNALDNSISGNNAGNVIAGGLGDDTLTGNGGYDRFVFNTALNAATNVDVIMDYALEDQINLENAIFTALTSTGFLSANLFKNTAMGAIDADDRIIYNSATGALTYDTDGSGAASAIIFAQLSSGLAITAGEFFVV